MDEGAKDVSEAERRAFEKMMAKEERYRVYWARKRLTDREKQKERKRIAKAQQEQQSTDHHEETHPETEIETQCLKPRAIQRGKRKRLEKRGFIIESFIHNRPELVIDLSFIDPLRLPRAPDPASPSDLETTDSTPRSEDDQDDAEEREKRDQRDAATTEERTFLTIKDIRRVIRQIQHCYGYLRKAEKPLPIHLTSFSDRLQPFFQRYDGSDTWLFVKHNDSYLNVFDPSRIVYLTPDSPHPLTEFDDEAVYVIGGLDDHNKQTNATLEKASSQGIRTARLPLTEFCPDRFANKSLTINQGFSSLLLSTK